MSTFLCSNVHKNEESIFFVGSYVNISMVFGTEKEKYSQKVYYALYKQEAKNKNYDVLCI